MGITILEQEDLFYGGATSNDEPKLAMFRYKEEAEKYVTMQASEGVSWTFNLINTYLHNISYFNV